MITWESYQITNPDELATPAMVLFEDLVDHNIRSACELAGGSQNLFTHVKTHKSEAITLRQIEHGIESFKCATLNELEMVLQIGARRAILAYPQTQAHKIERLFELAASCPHAWIATIASSPVHLEMLGNVAVRREQSLPVMLDLDPGMHRTGVAMDNQAVALYGEIDAHPFLEAAGLHWYDGHDTFCDEKQRAAAAERHIESLQEFRRQLESATLPVPFVVAGGAYSFAYYARTEGMYGSPGSFIYWDDRCSSDMPDMPFKCAALILTQVVDRHPDRGTFTTDLGNKGICSDQPMNERARLLGYKTAELVLHNEEYGVFRTPGELPGIGEYLLAVPGHVGPTTVRYPGSHVIDSGGSVIDYFEHTARDRNWSARQLLARLTGIPGRLPVTSPSSSTSCPLTQTFSIPTDGT
jgi:D-serine deaminase-like pyridoxal phosphate-dependent protein